MVVLLIFSENIRGAFSQILNLAKLKFGILRNFYYKICISVCFDYYKILSVQ